MPSEVLSNLYIGDFHDARQVDPSDFYRVTVAQELEGVGDEHFPLLDGPYAENVPHLDRAIERVADLLAEEKRVLVHCAAGISRSASGAPRAPHQQQGPRGVRSICRGMEIDRW